jgi:tetratricopeptide (TPR) repeat protein
MSESDNSKRKLLSITFGVRNDHYVENYSWRVSTIMNYIAFGLARIGRLDDVELVVADWNSPTRMADELNLSDAARKIVRFFDVPSEVAIPAQLGSSYPGNVILNSAARRASGEFICMTDNDCLYTPAALDMLCRLLDGSTDTGMDLHKVVMATSRRMVGQELTLCSPNVEEIDCYLNHFASFIDEDKMFNGLVGGAGSFIMHRDLCDACGGIDEKMVYWAWSDVDMTLRTTRKYPWMNLSNFGVTVYHMGHPPTYVKAGSNGKKKTTKINVAQLSHPYRFNPNGKDWGLDQYDLPLYACPPAVSNGSSVLPSSSQEWRLDRLKGLSRQDVQNQLVSDENRRCVFDFLNLIEKNIPHKIPGVQDGINRYQMMLEEYNSDEWDYLSVIAWYCRNFFPLTYMEAGMGRGLTAFLAAYLYPPVSIYGFESWNPFDNPLALHPRTIWEVLGAVKHRGYMRYITDQSPEAYRQFWEQTGSPSTVDMLIYANPSPCDQALKEIRPLLQHLAQGGCLILKHLDGDILAGVIVVLKSEFPCLAWFINGQNAFALNTAGLPGWVDETDLDADPKQMGPAFVADLSLEEVSAYVARFLEDGEEEEAVAMIRAQIQTKPGDAGLHLLMGTVLNKLNLPRNAQYYFERSIEINPSDLVGYANLSIALARAGDLDESEKVLLGYLQNFPDNAVMIRLRGDMLTQQGRHEEAFESYQKLLELNPNDVENLLAVANCVVEIGDLAKAQNVLSSLRTLRPGVAEIESKWNAINQRIFTASEMVQKILSTRDLMATVQQNIDGLSADVVYLIRYNAGQLREQGEEELAGSYETLAQSLQNLIVSRA